MCPLAASPDGSSTVPAAIETVSRPGARQNRLEPQWRQKARSADVVEAGLAIQASPSSATSSRRSAGQAVYGAAPPCMRRHSPQWQVMTSRSGPATR